MYKKNYEHEYCNILNYKKRDWTQQADVSEVVFYSYYI